MFFLIKSNKIGVFMKKQAKQKGHQEKPRVENNAAKPCCGCWSEGASKGSYGKTESAAKGSCHENKHRS